MCLPALIRRLPRRPGKAACGACHLLGQSGNSAAGFFCTVDDLAECGAVLPWSAGSRRLTAADPVRLQSSSNVGNRPWNLPIRELAGLCRSRGPTRARSSGTRAMPRWHPEKHFDVSKLAPSLEGPHCPWSEGPAPARPQASALQGCHRPGPSRSLPLNLAFLGHRSRASSQAIRWQRNGRRPGWIVFVLVVAPSLQEPHVFPLAAGGCQQPFQPLLEQPPGSSHRNDPDNGV